MHRCNEDDFKKMKNPSRGSKHRISKLREAESLFCFDKTDIGGKNYSTKFYGKNDNTEHRRIEFIFMPCLTYKEMTNRTDKENITCKGSLDNYE